MVQKIVMVLLILNVAIQGIGLYSMKRIDRRIDEIVAIQILARWKMNVLRNAIREINGLPPLEEK